LEKSDTKYSASYINALSEERDPRILFDLIVQLYKENADLREKLASRPEKKWDWRTGKYD
jgi:hypothetical protein